jgi:hypothetical protein
MTQPPPHRPVTTYVTPASYPAKSTAERRSDSRRAAFVASWRAGRCAHGIHGRSALTGHASDLTCAKLVRSRCESSARSRAARRVAVAIGALASAI